MQQKWNKLTIYSYFYHLHSAFGQLNRTMTNKRIPRSIVPFQQSIFGTHIVQSWVFSQQQGNQASNDRSGHAGSLHQQNAFTSFGDNRRLLWLGLSRQCRNQPSTRSGTIWLFRIFSTWQQWARAGKVCSFSKSFSRSALGNINLALFNPAIS